MKDLVFALMTPVGNYKEKQALGTNHTPSQIPSLIDRDLLPPGFVFGVGRPVFLLLDGTKMEWSTRKRGAVPLLSALKSP